MSDTPPGPARQGVPRRRRRPGRRRGLWVAVRAVVGVVAVLLLVVTGTEWVIKSNADAGIQARSVQAVDTSDANIATPTATVPGPAATYPAENILLLGSDSRAGANGNVGNTNSSVDTSVASRTP